VNSVPSFDFAQDDVCVWFVFQLNNGGLQANPTFINIHHFDGAFPLVWFVIILVLAETTRLNSRLIWIAH
jgi:hypothetical protein